MKCITMTILWNVANVKSMSYMFWLSTSFNGDVSLWKVDKVTDMSGMFAASSSFNQNLCSWGNKLSSGVRFDIAHWYYTVYGRTIFENSSCPCEGTPNLNLFPSTSFCACDCNSTATVPFLWEKYEGRR